MNDSALAANVVQFCRVLRASGMTIGPGRVLEALRALPVCGLRRRDDFYWALVALLLDRHENMLLFDEAFRLFWRERHLFDGAQVEAKSLAPSQDSAPNGAPMNRLAEALARERGPAQAPRLAKQPTTRIGIGALEMETLRRKDFQAMSLAEQEDAKRMLSGLHLPLPQLATRRLTAVAHGSRVSLRLTLRASLRGNADVIPLRHVAPRRRSPPLVVLCDISGSMSTYTRMLLHFLHALVASEHKVHCFVFGTRLTNITRPLRRRDVDLALSSVTAAVADWSGGTRIGAALDTFNRHWSRRVLGQNAAVLLITDGMERESAERLGPIMERLHKSCSQLLWLNPLLRFDAFVPLAHGIRQMLPHVDAFLPAHNVGSLMQLAEILGRPPARQQAGARPQHQAA